MTSRGFLYALGAGARKSFVLLWTAVLLCSLLLQYVAIAAPAPVLTVHDLDEGVQASSANNGLLLVLLGIAGLMLVLGYLVPAPARARNRSRSRKG